MSYSPGTLSAVGDLNISSFNYTITLTWTAPFSLDMVDITYMVQVMNSTTTLMEDMMEFSYPLSHDSGCDNLVFTITPLNEAGEGLSNSISLSQALKCKIISYNNASALLYHARINRPWRTCISIIKIDYSTILFFMPQCWKDVE